MTLHLDRIDAELSDVHSDIGGNIYLQIGQDYFPEENWYDYASMILEQWIPGLISFAGNSTNACKLRFYDGPCYALLCRTEDSVVTVKCFYGRKIVIEETLIDFPSFVKSVVKAGNRFCRMLHLQGREHESITSALRNLKSTIKY